MIERPMYADKIMAYVDTPFVKILTGVRRCGKSTILKMIMERLKNEHNVPGDRILSYRFDSMEYDGATAKQISPPFTITFIPFSVKALKISSNALYIFCS